MHSWRSPSFADVGGNTIPRLLTRAGVLLLPLAAAAILPAVPAAAHGGLVNYSARVTAIEPPLPGLEISVVGGDDQVLLTNDTGRVVTVPGYEGEPYLRFETGRVMANRKSPAYYLGAQRTGAAIPPEADPTATPEWVQVATGNTFAWHDQRVLWSEAGRPPGVESNPGTRQVVRNWQIVLDVGGPVVVRGVLEWVPSADGSIWLGVGLVLLVTGGVAGRRFTRGIEAACRTVAPAALAPALTGVAVALNAWLDGSDTVREAATILFAVLSTLLGLRARMLPSGATALSTAAALLVLAFLGGASRFDQVSVPINGPEDQLLPLAIVLTAGLAALVAALLLVAAVRHMRSARYSTATM